MPVSLAAFWCHLSCWAVLTPPAATLKGPGATQRWDFVSVHTSPTRWRCPPSGVQSWPGLRPAPLQSWRVWSMFLTSSLSLEPPAGECLDQVHHDYCQVSFTPLLPYHPTALLKKIFLLSCNTVIKNQGNLWLQTSRALAHTLDAQSLSWTVLDLGRDSACRRKINGLTETHREKNLEVLAAQNKETQNHLQKKSILLGLSFAVTMVGVDVTFTNKTPLKACSMYVSGAF